MEAIWALLLPIVQLMAVIAIAIALVSMLVGLLVALLKASIIGLCQFVICTGQAANKIARAAKAGFIKF